MKELITDFKNLSAKKKLAIGVVSFVILILVLNMFRSSFPSSIAEAECKHLVKYWEIHTIGEQELKLTDFSETEEMHRTSSLLVCVSRATREVSGMRDYWDLRLEENEEGKLWYSIKPVP